MYWEFSKCITLHLLNELSTGKALSILSLLFYLVEQHRERRKWCGNILVFATDARLSDRKKQGDKKKKMNDPFR